MMTMFAVKPTAGKQLLLAMSVFGIVAFKYAPIIQAVPAALINTSVQPTPRKLEQVSQVKAPVSIYVSPKIEVVPVVEVKPVAAQALPVSQLKVEVPGAIPGEDLIQYGSGHPWYETPQQPLPDGQ